MTFWHIKSMTTCVLSKFVSFVSAPAPVTYGNIGIVLKASIPELIHHIPEVCGINIGLDSVISRVSVSVSVSIEGHLDYFFVSWARIPY